MSPMRRARPWRSATLTSPLATTSSESAGTSVAPAWPAMPISIGSRFRKFRCRRRCCCSQPLSAAWLCSAIVGATTRRSNDCALQRATSHGTGPLGSSPGVFVFGGASKHEVAGCTLLPPSCRLTMKSGWQKFCAAQNYSHAPVLTALTIAYRPRYGHDVRYCSIGAWLLNCLANGDADGAD